MSEDSWVLRGVDPQTRQSAEEEAERLGLSLAEFLTRALSAEAPEAAQGADFADENSEDVDAGAEFLAAAPAAPESNYALRHRVDTLERRLGLSVSGLDSALHGLDSSVFGLAARVDESEQTALDAAAGVIALGENVSALRKRLSDAEGAVDGQTEVQDRDRAAFAHRCAGVEARLDHVASVAHAADSAALTLADAHEALKRAVAEDFIAFAHENGARIEAGLRDMRAAAEAAAAEADAAVARLASDLSSLRQALEQRLTDNSAEIRVRMQAGLADVNGRAAALSNRLDQAEQLTRRTAEQLRAQISDIEDCAQAALEDTAETLRQAGAALAADLHRATEDNRAALDRLHGDIADEIDGLRDQQGRTAARLKQVDAGLAAAVGDLAALRNHVDATLQQRMDSAQAAWDQRFEALAARLAHSERNSAETNFALSAETDRVEACTFAALEKLAGDIAATNLGLDDRLAQHEAGANALIDSIRQRLDAETAGLREQSAGAMARIKLLEAAEAAHNGLAVRVDDLLERVDSLAKRAQSLEASQPGQDLIARIDDLRAQLAAHEASVTARTDKRLHEVEMAMADLRLERLAAPAESVTPNALAALERRLAAFEEVQGAALKSLQAEIAHFIGANDRRLSALERPSTAPAPDLANAFETLRARVEERIVGIELRSVRTLEQVADTVAMLENRFVERDGQTERQAG
jgi:localization factor PodJL